MAIAVSEQLVRGLADSGSFERGRDYFLSGRVRALTVDGVAVSAVVDGGRAYRVRLDVTSAGLDGRCNCPYGAEGFFCKHCVAVALAWLDRRAEPIAASSNAKGKAGDNRRLRKFLLRQDVSWLVTELMRAAETDPLLRARLDVAAGVDAGDAFDDRNLRKRLERAIEVHDFVGYREAYAYFGDVEEVLAGVADLIGEGFADAARALAEYALELLESVGGLIDDSDGALREAISRAEGIHFDACSAGAPNPVRLAEVLVERALGSEYEIFLSVLPDYASVLGSAGMARYRELVEAAWQALPPKRPHDYSSHRFTVTFLMERLAECEGGADALIGVLSRDVACAYDVLRIAERLCQDGRDAEALDWLERGLSEFPPDPRLRSLAAACHVRAGDRGKAQELLWDNFAEGPSLDGYVALHDVAGKDFAGWRDRALRVLRDQPTSTQRFAALPFSRLGGHSTLVEVLLWEGDVDAAWDAATAGGCRDELWLRLARARAATHPGDAIAVLQAAADQAIGGKNRRSYQMAAILLVEAQTLSGRCDRLDEFDAHLLALRTTHKPKRALREELDRAGLR